MADYFGIVPINCDEILFAEDLVSYIFQFLNTDYKPSTVIPFRELIYQGFDSIVKGAVHDIYIQVKQYRTLKPYKNEILDRKQFKKFARELRKKFLPDGFDARFFLFYCAHIAVRASLLAKSMGVQEAGDLAVHCILTGFDLDDMFDKGWSSLSMQASNYASNVDHSDKIIQPLEDEYPEISISEAEEDSDDDDMDVKKSDKSHATDEGELNSKESNECARGYIIQELKGPFIMKLANLKNAEVTKAKKNTIRVLDEKQEGSKSCPDVELQPQKLPEVSQEEKGKKEERIDIADKQVEILDEDVYSDCIKYVISSPIQGIPLWSIDSSILNTCLEVDENEDAETEEDTESVEDENADVVLDAGP